MSARDLRNRLTFSRREEVSDGYGNVHGEWVEQFSRPAALRLGHDANAALAAAELGARNFSALCYADGDLRIGLHTWTDPEAILDHLPDIRLPD